MRARAEKEQKKKGAICARVDSVSHAIDLCRRRFRQGSSVVEQPQKRSGLVVQKNSLVCARNKRQGSSVVEQGTHKPLVGSSNLPPGMFSMRITDWRSGHGFNIGAVVLSEAKDL